MTTIDIDDKVYEEWVELYESQDKLEYPYLKNFTARKLKEIILKEKRSGGQGEKAKEGRGGTLG